jgi:hypothetical protein
MEHHMLSTKDRMDFMNQSMVSNSGRLEYLESKKKELEGTIEVKHQQTEQVHVSTLFLFLNKNK